MSYAYQWKRNGASISGATANTYTQVTADIGAMITATVTATNAAGSTSATATAVGPVLTAAPVNSALPAITGSTVQGGVLTATTGTWSGSPTYAYQWKRGSTNVGTNANTYTTVVGDIGSTITVVVTATNAFGNASATSAAVGPITSAAVAPANTALPAISGSTVVGNLLTATSGTWTGSPTPTYAYQWKRGATNVGTNVNTYTTVSGDIGSTITVVVTATNSAGNASATSLPTATITAGNVAPSNSVAPVISGSTVTGGVLTATNGTWAGSPTPTFSYQWKRGATNVGTSVNTYTTVVADEGFNITCVVTGTNVAGSANATSNALGPITAPSLTAPVLVWTSGPSVLDPVFTATYTAAVADTLTLEIDNNSDFSSLFDSEANVLDAGEVAAGTVTYAGISTLSGGVTYYARLKLQRGAASVYSNTVSQTMAAAGILTPEIDLAGVYDKGLSSTDNITNDSTPVFDVVCFTPPLAGDIIEIAKDGVSVSSATLTANDIAGTTAPDLGQAPLANGTYTFTARHKRGADISSYSAGVSVTIDTVAPVLTVPGAAQNGSVPSAVDLSVTTNTGQGRIYWTIQDAAVAAPSIAQIIDGMGPDNLYVISGRSGSFAVSSTGTKTASGTVSVSGSFRAYFTQTDTAGNNATVVTPAAPWTHSIGSFTANGVGGFDGSTTYLTNTGLASSIPAGKQGLISFWVKMLGGAATERFVFSLSTGGAVKFWCSVTAANLVVIRGRNSGSIDVLTMSNASAGTPFTPPPTGWIHVAMWWDLSLATPNGGVYINGALDMATTKTFTNDFIAYNQTIMNIGASATPALKHFGSLSELYINLHETLDLGVPANLAKFIGGGAPVALGATGTLPTGTQPEFYLGDNNTFADWGTNNGSKGNFTTPAGALTSVTGPP
jgi:hypothetical protein